MRKLLFCRTLPHFAFELLERYFRVEIEGEENLPRSGPAILLPNHSGFLGLDALLLSHWVCKSRGRVPRIMLHKLWFQGGLLRRTARSFGFVEASYEAGRAALERKKLLMLFPEGEEGNFKPTSERYELRDFRKGFVRLAAETGAPVIPVLIIGAEESNLTVAQVRLFNQVLPLPLNLLPLPAKWKIKFLPPIFAEPRRRTEAIRAFASKVRGEMQLVLKKELARRDYVYFKKPNVSPRKRHGADNNIYL
jgi:1-acyl-sn-glycerol-3-phosphate acyltransferase